MRRRMKKATRSRTREDLLGGREAALPVTTPNFCRFIRLCCNYLRFVAVSGMNVFYLSVRMNKTAFFRTNEAAF